MSKQTQKGTRAENACVDALIRAGFIHAERRAKNGMYDKGDLLGVAGWVFEVKGHDSYAGKLSGWLEEAEVEKKNARAQHAAVWHRRKGKGKAEDWYVTMTGAEFLSVLRELFEIED